MFAFIFVTVTYRDTLKLKKLIRARDAVLNNLEKAECLYIDSFRLSTPLPSEADDMFGIPEEPAETTAPGGKAISRPRPLLGSKVCPFQLVTETAADMHVWNSLLGIVVLYHKLPHHTWRLQHTIVCGVCVG